VAKAAFQAATLKSKIFKLIRWQPAERQALLNRNVPGILVGCANRQFP